MFITIFSEHNKIWGTLPPNVPVKCLRPCVQLEWRLSVPHASFSTCFLVFCLWKEILSQDRIGHFKILQSTYFTYVISSYANRIFLLVFSFSGERSSRNDPCRYSLHQDFYSRRDAVTVSATASPNHSKYFAYLGPAENRSIK